MDLDKNVECLFFPLEAPREKMYMFLVGKKELKSDMFLMSKIRTFVQNKMSSKIDVSYRVYEAPFDGVRAYCLYSASMVQQQNVLPA